MKSTILLFLLVLAVGFGTGFAVSEYRNADVIQTSIRLLKQIELQKLEDRSLIAYQQPNAAIAIWEMEHLLKEIDGAREVESQRTLLLKELLTRVRLAQLYGRSGQTNAAVKEVTLATNLCNRTFTNTTVTSLIETMRVLYPFGNLAISNGSL